MNFNKESKSEFFLGGGGLGGQGGTTHGGGGGGQCARLQMWSNTKKQPSTHCSACGTINISQYVNNSLNTNHFTLILSSLVSEFLQRL